LQCTEAYQEYLDKYGWLSFFCRTHTHTHKRYPIITFVLFLGVTGVQESGSDKAIKLLNQYLEKIRKLRVVSESQRKIMKEYDYYKDKVCILLMEICIG